MAPRTHTLLALFLVACKALRLERSTPDATPSNSATPVETSVTTIGSADIREMQRLLDEAAKREGDALDTDVRDAGATLPRVARSSVRSGSVIVRGRLPREVIERIVRQSFGRFRSCYENGLRTNPSLQGEVAVKFVIDRTGSVTSAHDAGSTLPDSSVVQCVIRAFGNLSFPQPEVGIVVVTFPVIFEGPSAKRGVTGVR